MAEKREIDWERVETDYRAGLLSVREIAGQHDISHTAVTKRAKRDGWDRDLGAKIKAKADALVAKREVAKIVSIEVATKERLIVQSNAEVIADVRMSHRSDIRRSKELVIRLLDELEGQTADRELFEQLGELMASPDDKGIDKLNDLYKKVIALPSRIDSMKKLSETLKNLIGLEREAYSIGPDIDPDKGAQDIKQTIRSLYA